MIISLLICVGFVAVCAFAAVAHERDAVAYEREAARHRNQHQKFLAMLERIRQIVTTRES